MEKIAIIDLGSNTARLVIAQIIDEGFFTVIDELKEPVRLGQDMERDGFLKTARVASAIKTLKIMKKLCDAHKVEQIFAVGTSAVRLAKNQKSFLDEVASSTGIKLRVLSEEEEAAYIYQGVINSTDIPKGIILEIGGGCTKIIYYNRRNILNHIILPFGAVTLTDLFLNDNIKSEEQAKKIENFFTEHLEKYTWLKEIDPDTQFVGVGGNIRSLGKICRRYEKYPFDMGHNYQVSKQSFDSVYDIVKVLDIEKKKKIKGLSLSRADIFPSALAIVKAFVEFMQVPEITVSGCGLRDGLLFNHCIPSTIERPLSDVLGHSLQGVLRLHEENEAHIEQVCSLSLQLFKQLRVLHKFPRQYIKVLRVASALYSSGKRIRAHNFPKHSFYFILNANLYGVSHKDIVHAAFIVASFSSDGVNTEELAKYKNLLTEEDIDSIKRLGVMLKIAICLDRSMSGAIKSLNCDVLGDSVIMKTETQGDASLDIKEAFSVDVEFRKAFKKNLEIL